MTINSVIAYHAQRYAKNQARWQRTADDFPLLWTKLEQLEVDIALDHNYGSIDLRASGNTQLLNDIWGALRQAGFQPTTRPQAKELVVSNFWEPPPAAEEKGEEAYYSTVWLYFSSSVCKRVQVGTRTVEQPIFEIQCEGEG